MNISAANNSNITNDAWHKALTNIKFFWNHIFPFIIGCALTGTLLLLITLIFQRRVTRLPVTNNIAMSSLLVVDAVFLIQNLIDICYYSFKKDYAAYSSITACYITTILLYGVGDLQGYLQCVISVERVLAVVVPMRVQRIVTRPRIITTLIITSGIVFSLTILYTFFGHYYDDFSGECKFYENRMIFIETYLIVVVSGIPSIVLISTTSIIIIALIKRHKTSLSQASTRISVGERRLTAILVTLNIIYLLTTLPVTLFVFLRPSNSDHSSFWEYHHYVVSVLARLAPMTDWLVILCLGRQIRQALVGMICRWCRRPPTTANVRISPFTVSGRGSIAMNRFRS